MSTFCYKTEGSQEMVNDMTTSPGNDIFKHENESVDLLLKEMNQYPNTLDASETTSDSKGTISLNNSPVKPLSFPKQTNSELNSKTPNLDLNNKEFNSSSDTCISESDSPRPTSESNTNNNSFERNFSFDDSDQINKTIQTKIKLEDEEFSFITQTPMTSTIDLNNPNKEEDTPSNYNNSSPNKSIMKKTDSSSPLRKSVVFTNSTPEIHHYPSNKPNITTTSNEESIDQLPHEWNELPKELSQSSDDDNQIPPVPPIHKTDTISSLLQDDNNDEDMDRDTLNELKLQHHNFSNLSLNEKLDVFLSNKHVKKEELDDHLTNLDNAVKNKTGSNIHVLSLDLKKQEQIEVENPLNSLMKSSEVRLRSAGSSQSSLQSLVESNRYLESNGHQYISNKGIELNDGIKGFSNHMVEALIPTSDNDMEDEEEEDDAGLMMKTPSNSRLNELKQSENNDSENEEFHDSFDTNTEQSIMNLLKSASNSDLNKPSSLLQLGNILIKQEEDEVEKEEEEEEGKRDVVIKHESTDLSQNGHMLSSDDEHQQDLIKPEFNDDIKKEAHINYHEYEATSKIESVSGYGRTHKDIRLIKSELNNTHEGKESEISNINTLMKVNDQTSVDDTSEVTDSANKFSIRDHIDSDWKFEDSNDGDREDNDDYTNNDLTTVNDVKIESNKGMGTYSNNFKSESLLDVNLSPNLSVNSQEFKDASDHFIGKTLAPRSVDEAIDATHPPVPLKDSTEEEKVTDMILEDYNEDVLANSSNIAPPGEITLPQVEANNYSSFDDITKNLEKSNNSYEESLSAENDADKKPLDFISIWHSQERQKKPYNTLSNSNISPSSYDVNKASEVDSSSRVRFPSSLQPKKFKEVNVMSRRVVSPGFEDLHVSGFLPELSEDSGFGSQLKLFKSGYNTSGMSNYSHLGEVHDQNDTPLNTRNVLSNLDNNINVAEPPKAGNNFKKNSARNEFKIQRSLKPELSANQTLKPNIQSPQTKQSKFRVPSFEIRRTNSTLSPVNQYDEIFEDVLKQPPTIKSHGMKTLPSMDRDDVKRILATKRVISQEEYSKVKLVGNSKKNSIVNEPNDKYDDLQQHASICNVSVESSPVLDKEVLPHLANELLRVPSALLSKDQLFNEFDFVPKTSDNMLNNNSQSPSRTTSVIHNKEDAAVLHPENYVVSEPIPSSLDSGENIKESILTPADKDASPKRIYQVDASSESISPKKRATPIKISSPTKLVKKDSGIASKSVSSPSKIDEKGNENGSSFAGEELINKKLRESPAKSGLRTQEHNNKPSTVSVPSFYSNDTANTKPLSTSNKDCHSAWQQQKEQQTYSQLDIKDKSGGLQERGKLFLRVIGLKNIDLPDINEHHADFSITLDNGVHCIKTSSYKMDSHNTLINKEFELTVGDSLEFILTMKASYEKPRGKLLEVKERRVVKSRNRLSRLFGSKDIITTTKFVPQDMKDAWSNKIAQDGSFARCYVDLDQYESKITGEACNFNITCFNEWETISGKGNEVRTRCQPYRIGQLEVKMMFVPRTNNQEILPTSIKSAYECIEDLHQESMLAHEGYLHQEGGDCEILKKRFFKLQGTSLVAHSEFSHKTRAKINLSKIIDVIYVDEKDINKSSANYRNFSDVILVPHSFKIRFANGEVIDFGAPNRAEKLEWITILEKIVYRNKFRRQPWVKLMVEEARTKKELPNERSRTKKIF